MLGLTLSLDINSDSINSASVGILVMLMVGWLPLIGPLIAGFIAGTFVRTGPRGLKMGVLTGIVGAFWIYLLFGQFSVSITPYGFVGTILDQLTMEAYVIGPTAIAIAAFFMAIIGGTAGGIVTNQIEVVGYRRGQEVERAVGHLSRLRAR